MSSVQFAEQIVITQKVAWFVLQRARKTCKLEDFNIPLQGAFETDEACLGGREWSRRAKDRRKEEKEKTVSTGAVIRIAGRVKTMKAAGACQEHLLPRIYLNLKDNSVIACDIPYAFKDSEKHYNHKTIRRSAGEHHGEGKGNENRTAFKVCINSTDSFCSLLKRCINGIYLWASVKHIQGCIRGSSNRYATIELQRGEKFF